MASLRLIAGALALAACYQVPTPACGFQCGPDEACPDDYTCVAGRCQLDVATECPEIVDPEIVDRTPPGVQARSPMPDEVNVALDTVVLVTFDETVGGVEASTFGLATDTGFVLGAVTVVSPGRAWRFTPNRPLAANKTYEAVLGSAISDLAGNRLLETRWTFQTIEDRTGPQLVGANFPAEGASLTDDLIVVFDEAITGVTPLSVRLEQAGTIVPTTLVFGMFPDQFLLQHEPLLSETTYSLIMTSDITDLHGNPITPTTLTFTTRDATPPSIASRAPAASATDVPVDSTIAVTFSEDVDVDMDSVQLSSSAGAVTTAFAYDSTFTVTLTPTAPLDPATEYTVSFPQPIRDLANNPATFPSYTFTTAPP